MIDTEPYIIPTSGRTQHTCIKKHCIFCNYESKRFESIYLTFEPNSFFANFNDKKRANYSKDDIRFQLEIKSSEY